MKEKEKRAQFRGCLIGGAVGDALGAAVEFMSLGEIKRVFGAAGLTDYAPAFGVAGTITDDTQLTLFTAEGLLRARANGTPPLEEIWRAYRRWAHTQGVAPWDAMMGERIGLVLQQGLHHSRAPGSTCLAAMQSGQRGTVQAPLNDSKGCGGVMRVAPVGLAGVADPFQLGLDVAALTHGHPSGYLPAGFFALLISQLLWGCPLSDAITTAQGRLALQPGHEETSDAVAHALTLAQLGPPRPGTVERLGGGWTGHEALAIALLCSITAENFAGGVLRAVNHSGDSDSTGSLTGQILGVLKGELAISNLWPARLELRELIRSVSDDMFRRFGSA